MRLRASEEAGRLFKDGREERGGYDGGEVCDVEETGVLEGGEEGLGCFLGRGGVFEEGLHGNELDVVGERLTQTGRGLTGIGSSEVEPGVDGGGSAAGAIARGR